jgi:hypothetical protein
MLIVTIAALLMAATLGWFAYRLMQDEQRRSDARVALLTAALDDDAPSSTAPVVAAARMGAPASRWPSVPPAPAPVAPARHAPATPRIVLIEDDDQKVGAFPSEHDEPAHAPYTGTFAGDAVLQAPLRAAPFDAGPAEAAARATGLFADAPEPTQGNARALVGLAGVVVVAALAAGYAWFGGSDAPVAPSPRPAAPTASATPAAAASTGVPLELVSLAHEQRDGLLVIKGAVRNPVAASVRTGVIASVVLLDGDGQPLGSARSSLAGWRLRPGGETSFTVKVAAPEALRRYRVTFRDAREALVPHTDRRAAGGRS